MEKCENISNIIRGGDLVVHFLWRENSNLSVPAACDDSLDLTLYSLLTQWPCFYVYQFWHYWGVLNYHLLFTSLFLRISLITSKLLLPTQKWGHLVKREWIVRPMEYYHCAELIKTFSILFSAINGCLDRGAPALKLAPLVSWRAKSRASNKLGKNRLQPRAAGEESL